jgi:hypothetical protein
MSNRFHKQLNKAETSKHPANLRHFDGTLKLSLYLNGSKSASLDLDIIQCGNNADAWPALGLEHLEVLDAFQVRLGVASSSCLLTWWNG